MLKKIKGLIVLSLIAIFAVSCQKNFYSGKAKDKDCGCPQKKGMVGY